MADWVYDIETFPNIFSFCAIKEDGTDLKLFECSTRKNQIGEVYAFLDVLRASKDRLVGYNNISFDYPVVHGLLEVRKKATGVSGKAVAIKAYKLAMEQIKTGQDDFAKTISLADTYVKQIDLYKIWHFDNKARATSLKMLQFNMKSDTIEDLPFPVGTELTEDQMDVLLKYNAHDVTETLQFYNVSKEMIGFREQLTKKYRRNFLNHNDTKIGKDYFIMQLEKALPHSCYKIDDNGKRVMNQTKRPTINIGDCLFNYYNFTRPEFNTVFEWFAKQTISETKGVFSDLPEHLLGKVSMFAHMEKMRKKFKGEPTPEDVAAFKQEYPEGWVEKVELKAKKKGEAQYSYWKTWNEAENLNVVVDGFRFDFGTGGIHGSISSQAVKEDEEYEIVDADVSSMYPNIAIANRVYPEHLGEEFCNIYEDLYQQRKNTPKGSAENAMLKLALNGVYGDSNNQYSPFYDPKYTMTITVNGQLSLCLLAEQLLSIEGLTLIQVNTDGVTVKLPRNQRQRYDDVCTAWQKQVGLQLEFAFYSAMYIRDVNNYIAVYTNGKVKRKGQYQYESLGWHQNQGGLVIPMAAEAAMLRGEDVAQFISNHQNKYDFLLRTKVPRSSKLVLVKDNTDIEQQNICRYYISNSGGKLVKIMPPLVVGGEDRRLGIDTDWDVKICNNISDYNRDDLNFDYYISEANKLVITEKPTL
jgi:hypothetical protein